MCLSVYIGCEHQFDDQKCDLGTLGLEQASWCPPPLKHFKNVYYVGRKGMGEQLECSCVLLDHVVWDTSVPHVEADPLYPDHGDCPFDTLREFIRVAAQGERPVALACDDSGGCEQDCSVDDYDQLVLTLDMIRRNNFLFVDPIGQFPWRVFHLISGRK